MTSTKSLFRMLPIPEAQEIILRESFPLGAVEKQYEDALGCILAEDVLATESHPPFPASIKDGYAIVASDGPGEYPVVAEIRAGSGADVVIQPGSVAYITTGSPVPTGADAVIQVEDTEPLGEVGGTRRVRILKASRPGQDIRKVGSDISPGQVVLAKGEVIGPAELGLLATVGLTRVQVHPHPKVAVMSTGDEVVDPATQNLSPSQIRDSNRCMLLAAARSAAGCPAVDLGIAPDSLEGLEGLLDRAIAEGVDVLITSGGVSMGNRDLVKPLLEKRGTIHFGRVLMKPGKPLTFATIDLSSQPGRRLYVFGLPGNPVSSIVCFHLAVMPCLRKLAGWRDPMPRRINAVLTSDLKLDPERPEYHRVSLQWEPAKVQPQDSGDASVVGTGRFLAFTTGNQISSRLLSARSANGLLELPQREGVLPKGTVVTALLIDNLMGMTAFSG